MRLVIIFAVALLFWVPLNLMPLPDFPNQFLAVLVVVSFFVFVLIREWKFSAFSLLWYLFVIYFVLAAFSVAANYSSIRYSLNSYFLAFIVAFLLMFCVSVWVRKYGRAEVQHTILISIVLSGFGVGVIGLLRHYGLLACVLPWMTVVGERFVGPWGQPNLTALILVLGVVGWVYWCEQRERSSLLLTVTGAAFLIYCGTLTGSRAWLLMMVLVTLVPLIRALWHLKGIDKLASVASYNKHYWVVFLVFLVVWPVSGFVDNTISKPLIEAGLLDRKPALEVLERQTDFNDSARLGEWRSALLHLHTMDNIWFGHGVGRYGNYSQNVKLIEKSQSGNGKLWTHPHNVIIMLLVEMGIIGGGAVILALLALGFWLLKLPMDKRTNALALVVTLLVFQNMVEFSFWFLPFLLVFVAVLVSLAPIRKLTWSNGLIPKTTGVVVLVVALTTGVLVARDYQTLTKVYIEEGRGDVSQRQIEQIKTSPFLGYAAYETSIVYFNPEEFGLEARLEKLNEMVEWRPSQAFMLRKASLMAALGKQGACDQTRNTTWLYPDTFQPLMRELEFVGAQDYQSCAIKGYMRWL